MASLIEYFIIAIAGMFVIINPLTTAFVFASLTADATEAERHHIARRAVVFFAIAVTTVSCYVTMVHSRHVIRWLGEDGRRILTKVFGLILAVIAVQFVINGVADAVNEFLAAREVLPPP